MTDVVRFGEPGGLNFPFEITGGTYDEIVIVYAPTTLDAVQLYVNETNGTSKTFDVRLMSDNE